MDGEDEVRYSCLICQAPIWPQDGGLCAEHVTFADLWSAVATGRCSDWKPNSGGYVSHPCMQLDRAYRSRLAWHVVIGDINRLARYWLDGWPGDDNVAA